MVRLADAEPVIVETSAAQRFKMTRGAARGALTPRTRLADPEFSPCNPTGAVYTAAEWRALGDVLARASARRRVERRDLRAHSVDGRAVRELRRRVSRAVRPHAHGQRHVERLRDERLANRLRGGAGPRHQSDDEPARPEHDERLHDLAGRRARSARRPTRRACATCAPSSSGATITSSRGVRGLPGFECVRADGTFYLFPNVEAAMQAKRVATDIELCERLLDEAGVALVPGTAFGAPGHLRLSFAASMSTLDAALTRLDEFLRR